MTDITYGRKYDANLDVAEIAKRLRKEIKQAVKAGDLPAIKASVRIKRYSGGQSINIYVTEAPFMINNPERVAFDITNNRRPMNELEMPRYSEAARECLNKLNAMLNAYNYDGSDSQSDYFNVNFYGFAKIDYEAEYAERDRMVDMMNRGFKIREKVAA